MKLFHITGIGFKFFMNIGLNIFELQEKFTPISTSSEKLLKLEARAKSELTMNTHIEDVHVDPKSNLQSDA